MWMFVLGAAFAQTLLANGAEPVGTYDARDLPDTAPRVAVAGSSPCDEILLVGLKRHLDYAWYEFTDLICDVVDENLRQAGEELYYFDPESVERALAGEEAERADIYDFAIDCFTLEGRYYVTIFDDRAQVCDPGDVVPYRRNYAIEDWEAHRSAYIGDTLDALAKLMPQLPQGASGS